MKRRTFNRLAVSAAALFAGGALRLVAAPARVVRAVASRAFPGRLRPVDPDAMKRPGKWSG